MDCEPTSTRSGRRASMARRSAKGTRTRRRARAATAHIRPLRRMPRPSRVHAAGVTKRRWGSSSRARTRRDSASAGSLNAWRATATMMSPPRARSSSGTTPDSACMKCHSHDEKPRKVAEDIAALLRGARDRAAAARAEVAVASGKGLHVAGVELRARPRHHGRAPRSRASSTRSTRRRSRRG